MLIHNKAFMKLLFLLFLWMSKNSFLWLLAKLFKKWYIIEEGFRYVSVQSCGPRKVNGGALNK